MKADRGAARPVRNNHRWSARSREHLLVKNVAQFTEESRKIHSFLGF